MAALLAVDAKELACVMIPLAADTHLLLPNVTIAEILPWRRIKPLPDAPKWCLGLLGWRSGVCAIIPSFARFAGFGWLTPAQISKKRSGRKMAVLRSQPAAFGHAGASTGIGGP